jgi:predicted RNA-binding protein
MSLPNPFDTQLRPVDPLVALIGRSKQLHLSAKRRRQHMCEANAYLLKDGQETLILEAVDVLEDEGDQIRMANIFGEQKILKAKIRRMSLVEHKIILEQQ